MIGESFWSNLLQGDSAEKGGKHTLSVEYKKDSIKLAEAELQMSGRGNQCMRSGG